MSYPIGNKEGVRVVSDMSRFEYDSETPQFRSRNPTPPSGLAYNLPKPAINDYTDTLNIPMNAPKVSLTAQQLEEVLVDEGPTPPHKDSSYRRLSSMYSQPQPQHSNTSPSRIDTQTPGHQQHQVQPQQYDQHFTPERLRPSSSYYPLSRRYSIGSSFPPGHYPPPSHLYLPAYEQAQYQSQIQNQALENNELPPMPQPGELVELPPTGNGLRRFLPETVFQKNPKKNFLRHMLLQQVMNKPVYHFPERDFDTNIFINTTHISYHFFLYFFEVIFEIIVIILSAMLLSSDKNVDYGIYRYFIGSSVVEVVIALGFLTTIIDFENRNGNFYCIIATVLCSISFIITCSQLLGKGCPNGNVCGMRRALLSFVIMSTFLWIITLTMYVTTLYVAKLDSLEEFIFHTQPVHNNNELPPQLTTSEYAASVARSPQTQQSAGAKTEEIDDVVGATTATAPKHTKTTTTFVDPETGVPLKQFYLSEQGEMYELQSPAGYEHHNKILVYTY